MDETALQRALADRYRLAGSIGEGGSAVVFLARDLRHGRDVALKVLRPELAASIGHERFLKEVQIAARLAHPNIVALYDSGAAAGFVYYVMPYVAGGSLRGLLRRAGALQLGHAVAIAGQVADALSYAHRMGVLHRDIKPENILVAGTLACVVDFGIAKALASAGAETLTRTGFAVGTPGYMSPEQAAGVKALDARSDIYGLGCVVYEMLVGETPGVWITDTALKVGRFIDAPVAHRRRLDGLPARVEQVLTRALALRVQDRWPTIDAFTEALGAAVEGPLARYTTAEVREIVGRAAQLQAEHPTAEPLFSVGTVERIAAEVDIPLEDVRRAMVELGFATPPEVLPAPRPVEPAPLPAAARATVDVDRVADGEVSPAAFDAMAATLTQALGPGRATVFDGQLTWRTEGTPATASRLVEVTVVPRAGKTRVRLTEWRWRVRGKVAAGGVGALLGAAVGSITGWLVGGGEPAVAQLFMVAGLAGGAGVFARAVEVTDTDNETARLTAVAGKLLPPAAAAPTPEAPGESERD